MQEVGTTEVLWAVGYEWGLGRAGAGACIGAGQMAGFTWEPEVRTQLGVSPGDSLAAHLPVS